MARPTPLRSLTAAAAALPLLALLGCGGSGDGKPQAAPADGKAAAPAASGSASAPAPASAPGARPRTSGPAAEPESPVPPGVDPKSAVAKVNGTPIDAEKAYSIYEMNKMMLQQRGRTLDATEDQLLKAQSLQVIVADELMYQAAVAAGIKVGPAEVDAGIKQLKSRMGSEENYKKFVESSKMTDADVRREVERNLQTEAYRKSLVAGQTVPESEAKKFYTANPDMFKVPELAHVQYILIKCTQKDPETVRADAKKRAEEAQKRAAAGEDFSALAKQYSQDATAAKGGDITPFPRGKMFPKFEEVAFNSKPGEVSAVFETPNGYNVMKLIDKKPESIRPFDEIKNMLILDMGRALEQSIVQTKIQQLASTAKIEVIDKSFDMPAPPVAQAPPPAQAPATKAPAKP